MKGGTSALRVLLALLLLAAARSLIGAPPGKPRARLAPLQLDVFGLGPPEIAIMGVAFLVIYGPDRLRGQLRSSGVKSELVREGWKREQIERIRDMQELAEKGRRRRAMGRLEAAIESGDPEVLEELALLEEAGEV